jgi:outer membrane protein OmpA-like peptidoglycan-associated protein
MHRYRFAMAATLALAVAAAGCGNRRFGACGVAGGLTGATIGAVGAGFGVNEIEKGPSTEEIAGGAGAGFVTGALLGALLGHLICDPEELPPPPPPVAAPPPPPPPPAKGTRIATVGETYFDFNKATLKPAAHNVLDDAVQTLRQNPSLRVEVSGHTDSVGSDKYNQRLSERRADAVKRYLVQQGIEASRIDARGYGESRPVADNSTASGRAQNRRAEITAE